MLTPINLQAQPARQPYSSMQRLSSSLMELRMGLW